MPGTLGTGNKPSEDELRQWVELFPLLSGGPGTE